MVRILELGMSSMNSLFCLVKHEVCFKSAQQPEALVFPVSASHPAHLPGKVSQRGSSSPLPTGNRIRGYTSGGSRMHVNISCTLDITLPTQARERAGDGVGEGERKDLKASRRVPLFSPAAPGRSMPPPLFPVQPRPSGR